MKIAYRKIDLSNEEERERLIDDLIVHVGEDDTARMYLEDIRDYMNEQEEA